MSIDIHPIALVVADIMILGGFLVWIAKPLRAGIGSILAMKDDVAEIKAQVLPNHGTSIRDAVDRLEDGQRDIKDTQNEHTKRMDEHIQAHFR